MEKNHQMKSQIRKTLITAAAICSLLAPTAHACTGIRLIAEDGTVIHARTMEFAIDIHSDVIMVPRGYARTGTTPDGKEGLKWKAKYASVGANGVGLPVLFDGLNEKGLAAGTFYFPTSAGYMPYLRNYVNFSMTNVPPVKLGSVTLLPFGQGSGMLGLPGDFTPPSRFVRAVAFSQSVLPSKTGADAVLEAFHILNQFDIPKGAAREHEKDEHGNILADYTIWTAASDLKAKRYYFRTYENSQIRMVDLMKMKIDGKDTVKISMKGAESIKSLTP